MEDRTPVTLIPSLRPRWDTRDIRSFRYSVDDGALRWSAEFRDPVEIALHPQPFRGRIEALGAGRVSVTA